MTDQEQEYDDMRSDLESGECAVIQCNGSKTTASFCGKHLATGDFDDLLVAVKEEMEFQRFWPNIYYVNDHGNVDLLDDKGDTVRSWV
jgi:hypothetical protein